MSAVDVAVLSGLSLMEIADLSNGCIAVALNDDMIFVRANDELNESVKSFGGFDDPRTTL